jgi:hypothetical protein
LPVAQHFVTKDFQITAVEREGRRDRGKLPPKLVLAGDGDLLDALEKMKPLVTSPGVEKVKRIAELMG